MDEPCVFGKEDVNHAKETSKERSNDPVIPGPIYFLVREQAKLIVTIKEIQNRIKSLEEVQSHVTTAVQDIHIQMNINSCNNTNATYSLPSGMRLNQLALDNDNRVQKDSERMQKLSQVSQDVFTENDSKLIIECDNKQDSGLESDHGHGLNLQTSSSSGVFSNGHDRSMIHDNDELLVLFDIINEKGLSLRQEIDNLKKVTNISGRDDDDSIHQSKLDEEMMRLHTEKLSLQQLIEDVEGEKISMKNKLMQLEVDSHELKHENRRLSDNLELALSEKQQLEMRIHNLHMQFVKSSNTRAESWPPEKPAIEGNLKEGTKMNSRAKVTSILKETNLLELQRKLLLYLMENEVLHAKLWHSEQNLSARQSEWKKTELNLNRQVRQLMVVNEELQIKLGENKLELTAAQAKIRMLEKVLGAVTHDSRDMFQSGPAGRYEAINKGAFSLPLTLANSIGEKQCNHYCREVKPFPNSSTCIDISLMHSNATEPIRFMEDNDEGSQYLSADLLEEIEHRSSTPVLMEHEWESYNKGSNSKAVEKQNLSHMQTEHYTTKSNCIPEMSVFEMSNFETPKTGPTDTMASYQSLSWRNSQDQKICTSFSDEKTINGSSIWKSNNSAKGGDSASKVQNCTSLSSLNDSSNAIMTSTVCQMDELLSGESHLPGIKSKKFQNAATGLDLGTQAKNSADIRQQIQDILDRITATADEALV